MSHFLQPNGKILRRVETQQGIRKSGFDIQRGKNFSCQYYEDSGSTQPPIQWLPEVFLRG